MKPLFRLRAVRLAGWAVGGAAAHAAFGVVSTVILARALGAERLGAFGVFLAVAFLLNQLGDLGLGTAYVRLATPVFQGGGDGRPLYATFLAARLAAVLLLGGLALAATGAVGQAVGAPEATRRLVLAGAAAAVLLALGGHHHEVLRARLRHKDAALARTTAAGARAATYGALAVFGRLDLSAAIATAIALTALEATILVARAHGGARLWPPAGFTWRRDWMALSGWLFVASGAGALMTHTDTLLLGSLGGATETGWWVAGSRLVGPLPLVIGTVWSVVLPISVALEDTEKLARYLGLAARTSLAAIVVAVLATPLVPPLVMLVFGADYGGAVAPARWLLLAYGANVAAILYGGLVLKLRLERELALVGLVQLAVNIAGDVWLIPRYGAAGCAAVTALVLAGGATWAVGRVTASRERLLMGER